MIKYIFLMMKLHYIRLKENDVPDFFSVAFISFLFYSLLYSLAVSYVNITQDDFIDNNYIIVTFVLILLGNSLVIFKFKKWHKLDAAIEVKNISNKTKYLSYIFIFICFALFAFFTFGQALIKEDFGR
ncbi:MAG TPA: hypothetical protein VL098_00680 [Flavipsychrobacter sp.]|nr:hypothetical protein [Flavipsychrobacter sp.]